MKASGYNLISLTVAHDYHLLNQTIHKFAKERAYFAACADEYVFVETVDDVLRANAAKKLAVTVNFLGTYPIDSDLSMIEVYYKLGVGHMLMVYNIKNAAGDGCTERTAGGLTRFGNSKQAQLRAEDIHYAFNGTRFHRLRSAATRSTVAG